jgi:hypothetical protein
MRSSSWLPCLVALTLAPASASDAAAADDVVTSQLRREQESLRVQRDRLVEELRLAWRELDAGEERGADPSSRLADATQRAQAAREKEAVLSAVLERSHEVREAIRSRRATAPASRGGGGDAGPLEGAWRLTIEGATGSMDLVQVGAMVTGKYRVDGGSAGTVSGQASRTRVSLTLLDEEGEMFAVLDGSVARTSLQGTYLRRELASGAPAQGAWSAGRSERTAPAGAGQHGEDGGARRP